MTQTAEKAATGKMVARVPAATGAVTAVPHLLLRLHCLCVDIYSCVRVFECLCFLETLPHNISTQTNSVTGATPPPAKTLTGGDNSQCTLRCQRFRGSNECQHEDSLSRKRPIPEIFPG